MTNVLKSFGFGGEDAARTATMLLRVSLGVLFLAHAGLKIFVFTPAGAAGYFGALGLPGGLAYVTIAAEVLGGIALIIGFQTSLVSLLLMPVLLGAAVLAHGPNGFWFNNEGGGWEYPAFWALTLLVQSLLGGGAYAVTKD